METHVDRRQFLKRTGLLTATAAAAVVASPSVVMGDGPAPRHPSKLFRISLAEWSLHKALFAKQLDHMDFPRVAKLDYGIQGIELVNQFFKEKAEDASYLAAFKQRAIDLNVSVLLIMIDGEGALGHEDAKERQKAVENHYRWAEAAKSLGCHSIRVNAETNNKGSYTEQQERAADGLRKLSEFAGQRGLNVIVENHGHLSSNGEWLAGVMRKVGRTNCGTLPDFGNFNISSDEVYDRYRGVQEMMPFAKAVSAKSHDFDVNGNEEHTDYRRMMRIVLTAGYRGWVGIEYEGDKLSESEGILHTKWLLEQIQTEFAPQFS
ncbi:MAG: sugar phosphate isomerase/epimerase [Verrucomicrobiales bacterium]|nr:sugar phosphate isomerase/epimerase [Verrucomicrobiales bacterium]